MNDAMVEVLHCPACGGRFSARRELTEDRDVVFLCGACGNGFSRAEATSSSEPSLEKQNEERPATAGDGQHEGRPRRGAMPRRGGRVVVGMEIPSAQRAVADVLRQHGFAPAVVSTGEMVVAACDPVMPEHPVAVVLDVAITGVLAFEAIQAIRSFAKGDDVVIVLLASVYERTRYKRRPNRLYGADAYLELHHVPDQLANMLDALLDDKEPPESRNQAPSDRAKTAPLRDMSTSEKGVALTEAQARAYARRLLSDVALYHGDEISRGVQAGNPLLDVKEAIGLAQEHYCHHAGDHLRCFREQVDVFSEQLLRRNVIHERSSDEENSPS